MTDRELKPGTYLPEETATTSVPDVVRVHHPETKVTKVVRRERLPQMDRAWEVEDPQELKGEALDQALKDADLPLSGSADEKRARLAEHVATTSEPSGSDQNKE